MKLVGTTSWARGTLPGDVYLYEKQVDYPNVFCMSRSTSEKHIHFGMI